MSILYILIPSLVLLFAFLGFQIRTGIITYITHRNSHALQIEGLRQQYQKESHRQMMELETAQQPISDAEIAMRTAEAKAREAEAVAAKAEHDLKRMRMEGDMYSRRYR